MDVSYLVKQIKAVPQGLRLRLAKAITVNADQTVDIQIAGDENTLPSIRYLSNIAPKPDDQLWVLSNGSDLLGVGMVADTARTLSPKAYRTALQAITSGSDNTVIFQAVENDDWGCWNVSNPSRLTVPVTGRYLVQAQAKWSDGASGVRQISIKMNGTQEIAYSNNDKATGHGTHTSVMSPPVTFQKGDYVELLAYSGTNLNLIITADGDNYVGWFPSMSLIYLGS
jgi:hypothetical protein